MRNTSCSLLLILAACAKDPPPRRFGDAMLEVGARFERLGKAGAAGKWELAAFEAGEIQEVFEDDLPHAEKPDDVPVDPQPLVKQFREVALPVLTAAAQQRDVSGFGVAFAGAAAMCNQCHQQSAKPFVVIPSTPGAAVPEL